MTFLLLTVALSAVSSLPSPGNAPGKRFVISTGTRTRSYEVGADKTRRRVYVFPRDFRLVRLKLALASPAETAQLLVKASSETWSGADESNVVLERAGNEIFCRFVVPPGDWEAFLRATGNTPVYTHVIARGEDIEQAAPRASAAGQIILFTRDGRSGRGVAAGLFVRDAL